ncbi:MAG: hypothetical protein ACYDEJ_01700 [Desulfitobacteriaceae bacterium]
MNNPLRLGFGPYSSYPYNKPNPYLNELNVIQPNYTCIREPLKPFADCLGSSAIWLLVPAGIGTVIALLLGFGLDDLDLSDQRSSQRGVGTTVIYTAFATLAISLFIFITLKDHSHDLLKSYLPLSLGLATLLVFYGTVYFLAYRLDPLSFSGDLGVDPVFQFLTFIYYSITTFATAQDGDIKAHTLSAKSLVSMEVLSFIYIFTLGIVLFTK